MIGADEALARLVEGNRRFTAGTGGRNLDFEHARRRELVDGQAPFAVVLGCSDSRVPLELIFDQGLGDLFVIRVAGNILAPSQVGSIEFAVATFGTPLMVVLGHTQCGAVAASVDEWLTPSGSLSPGLGFVVSQITPTVRSLHEAQPGLARDELVDHAVGANVKLVVNSLQGQSKLLSERLQEGSLRVAGGVYSLESGVVEFIA